MSSNMYIIARLVRLVRNVKDIEALSEEIDKEILKKREKKYKNN